MVTTPTTRHGSPTPPRRRTRLLSAARAARAVALWAGLVLAAALAAPATALGQGAGGARRPADTESLPIPEGSSGPTAVTDGAGGTMLRLGLGLVVVLALVAAVWFVLRRVQRSRYAGVDARPNGVIEIVSTTPLGPSRALHLVRVGEELILVGATEQSIGPVARIGEEAAAGLVDLAPPGRRHGPGAPRDRGPGADDRARAVATSEDAGLVERLRALTVRR